MPKFVVYVEHLVPHYRTVVVEAESEEEIKRAKDQIFKHAMDIPDWYLDFNDVRVNKCTKVEAVEITDDEPDLRL